MAQVTIKLKLFYQTVFLITFLSKFKDECIKNTIIYLKLRDYMNKMGMFSSGKL